MSIQDCRISSTSPFCTCYSQTKTQQHFYRQHEGTKQTYICCNSIEENPVRVRETAGGCCFSMTSPVQYLNYLQDNNINACDFKQFYGGNTEQVDQENHLENNFLELYNNAGVNLAIYNNFLCKAGTCYPLPSFGDHSVSCTAPYIPYTLTYLTQLDNTPYPQYATVCAETSQFSQISTPGINSQKVDYGPLYFYTNTGIPCITSECSLSYESGNYNNYANQGRFYSGKTTSDNTAFLGSGIALLVLGVIIFGILGYFIYKDDIKGKQDMGRG